MLYASASTMCAIVALPTIAASAADLDGGSTSTLQAAVIVKASGVEAGVVEASAVEPAATTAAVHSSVLRHVRVLALGLPMTHLLAVGTLDASHCMIVNRRHNMASTEERLTVPGLGAVLGQMAILVAVAALDLLGIERLWALSRRVSNGIAVATFRLARLGAFLGHVAFLTTIVTTTSTAATLGAVSRKVAS